MKARSPSKLVRVPVSYFSRTVPRYKKYPKLPQKTKVYHYAEMAQFKAAFQILYPKRFLSGIHNR